MKTQKIMLGVIIALVVAVIVIQLFVKQKVELNGMQGTSGVFNRSQDPQIEIIDPLLNSEA